MPAAVPADLAWVSTVRWNPGEELAGVSMVRAGVPMLTRNLPGFPARVGELYGN